MDAITLSIMQHSERRTSYLKELLEDFTRATGIVVNLKELTWVTGRDNLNRIALYQEPVDVSEIGTTWAPAFMHMNALRAFTEGELHRIGLPDEFAPGPWSTVQMPNDSLVCGIPWLAETYVLHYRRDLLRQAGIDEASAFTTHDQIEDTCARLRHAGVDIPFEMPIQVDRFGNLHALASWVWGAGLDFCTPDGSHVLFDQPQILDAMERFFALMRHTSPTGTQWLHTRKYQDFFRLGRSAVGVGTLMATGPFPETPSEVIANWGSAPLPQPCFVGGVNLVIWNHTSRPAAAVELVRFLTSPEVGIRCADLFRALPPRLKDLAAIEADDDPVLSIMARAIQQGRSYPAVRLWGVIEAALVDDLQEVAINYLENPFANLGRLLRQVLAPTARRLNITLGR